jgi:exodeoxyribonuclease VII small subunit
MWRRRTMTAKKSEKPGSDLTFEEAMAQLETIVSRLEQGNVPLEQSLASFEDGVGLLRALHNRLGDVEKRVEVLVRDAAGVLRQEDMGGDE